MPQLPLQLQLVCKPCTSLNQESTRRCFLLPGINPISSRALHNKTRYKIPTKQGKNQYKVKKQMHCSCKIHEKEGFFPSCACSLAPGNKTQVPRTDAVRNDAIEDTQAWMPSPLTVRNEGRVGGVIALPQFHPWACHQLQKQSLCCSCTIPSPGFCQA